MSGIDETFESLMAMLDARIPPETPEDEGYGMSMAYAVLRCALREHRTRDFYFGVVTVFAAACAQDHGDKVVAGVLKDALALISSDRDEVSH